ncbi:MAG: hypothetical protein V4605_04930 [Pseudomonadota bacterium]
MSKNPITGDNIITKPSNRYADNYDKIFRNHTNNKSPVKQELIENNQSINKTYQTNI